jgi:hypothetical protein
MGSNTMGPTNIMGPKRRMPYADATYVASVERRHRLDHPKGAVEDVCGLGMGEAWHENNKKREQ